MENDTTASRQRKYKLNNIRKGLKRVQILVPCHKEARIKEIAKKMRDNFNQRKKASYIN